MNALTRKIRFWALWSLIIFDVLFIALLAWQRVWIWAFFVLGVTGLVVLFEGLWYALEKKTISTEYKLFAQRSPIWAYLGLGLFLLIAFSLAVHLAVW